MLVPAQVVDQVCQGVVGRVPRKADHSAGHSVKTLFLVPEHMFHPHAQLRVLPIDGLLPFADLLASGVPLDHLALHPELPHHPLHPFADVGTVGEQILTPVILIHKLFHRLGIMNRRTGGHPFLDELAPLVHLGVVLVAEILLAALLHPSGIRVLLPFLVGFAPLLLLGVALFGVLQLAALAFLD